tara:strand:+ start:30001 stop:32181 length:2181 start_codon:yes stop_codon:yes gene_type:complete
MARDIQREIQDTRDLIEAKEEERRGLERTSAQYQTLTHDIDELTRRLGELTAASQGAAGGLSAVAGAGRGAIGEVMNSLSQGLADAKEGVDEYYKALSELFEDKRKLYVGLLDHLGTDYATAMEDFSQGSQNLGEQVGGTIHEMYDRFYTTDLPLYYSGLEEFVSYAEAIYYSVSSGYSAMRQLGDDAARQIESASLMAKGLGYSAEEMMDVMDAHYSKTGEFSNRILREITTYATAVSDVTGDSVKVISKGMADITTDFETFANVGVEQSAAIVAGLREVGLKVQDLADITSKFLNFDQAAESLANLNTVFGMQIDTFAMMEAASRDPMEALDMLREGFFATGQDFELLTQQEKTLLAAQANVSTEVAAIMFDPDRMRSSAEALQASVAQAQEEGTMTTEEAISSLEGSITRVTDLEGDFTDAVFNRMAMRSLSGLADQSILAHDAMTRLARAPPQVADSMRGILGEDIISGEGGLEGTLEAAGTLATEGLQGLATATQDLAGDIGLSVPENVLVGLRDPASQQILNDGGRQIVDYVQEGVDGQAITFSYEATGEIAPAETGGVNDALFGELGPGAELNLGFGSIQKTINPGDQAVFGPGVADMLQEIGAEGTMLERGAMAQQLGMSVEDLERTEAAADIHPVLAELDELTGMTRMASPPRATPQAGRALPSPAAGAETGTAATADRPVNLNLQVSLGGVTLADFKQQLVESSATGDYDFVVDRV